MIFKPKWSRRSGCGKGLLDRKQTRMNRRKIKVIIKLFLVWIGTFHHEICTSGSNGKKQLYQNVLALLSDTVRRKRPEFWLQHDNAPAHASLLFRSYLANYQKSVVPHPHYSPIVHTGDFFLFPNLEITLKNRRSWRKFRKMR